MQFLADYMMRSLLEVSEYCRQIRSLWWSDVRAYPSRMSYMQNRLLIQVFRREFHHGNLIHGPVQYINIAYVAGS